MLGVARSCMDGPCVPTVRTLTRVSLLYRSLPQNVLAVCLTGLDSADRSRFVPDGSVLASWGDDGAAEGLRNRCVVLACA